MMFSREAFIHDAELEIIVPNDVLDCNEEKIDYIIGAKQRTQIFYDELLHCYLISTLPPESNLENKEEAIDFFKNLEITLEATLINTNLAVPSDYYSSQLVHRAPSSSSTTSSSISGIFSSGRASIRSRSSSNSTSSTSPTLPGSPASDYNFKKFSVGKFTEGSVIYSVQYNSKSKNYDKMVVVKKDGRWICVLPLSFPVAYIRTRAHGQVTLSVNVTQPQRYSVEYFGMNLLEGLNDDPAFESLNTVCSIPSSRFTKQDPIKRVTSLASTHKILSVKPTLNVRIKITNVSSSENTLMMSVELENDTEHAITFSIEDVKIEVAHAFVTRYGWSLDTSNDKFPILLQPVDQVTLLYNVTILEDSSFPKSWNTQQRYPTPISHSEASSRRGSIASINPILNTLPIENKHRILSIIVKACPIIDGIKLRHIESRRNCMLDISTLLTNSTTAAHNPFNLNNIKSLHNIGLGNKNEMDGDNGILLSGRLPKLQKQTHLDVCGGVAVSFIVCGKPVVGRVFTIKVFMVNQSDQVRRFTIMIPNKKKLDERLLQLQSSPSTLLSQTTDITLIESNNINSNVENVENVKQPLRNPFMDETEFLRKHLEFEITDANLICLDDEVKVCSIDPYKSESTTLHFVSTKVALQAVELVQLVDIDTGFITNLRNVVQVDVKRNAKSQKIIGHNSVVLRHIEVTG